MTLVLVDESGDPGFKPGPSRYFSVAFVPFEEQEEANACHQRIDLLRHEPRLAEDHEFRGRIKDIALIA